MTNNELVKEIFKFQQHMTTEQQNLSTAFQSMIETEYELCATQMKKANKLAMPEDNSTNSDEIKINCACSEIDAIRKYWYNRLNCLVEIIQWRNPRLAEKLARKYLSNE